jgi:4-hydroxybenzoate polyprenyltransferase
MIDSAEQATAENTVFGANWKIQLGVLCGMLLLALIGMGLTQAMQKGAWEYWLFVVIVYAGLGLWRSTRKAKQDGQPIKQLISRELSHWMTLLAFLAVLMLLERKEIIDRDSASDVALMMLAFSCCLAGIHFDWMLMIVGVVLTIMLVALAMLEQYTVVLWVIMVLAVIGAAAYFYFKSKGGDSMVEKFKE